MAVSEIEPPNILKVLRRIESRGALETVHRSRTKVNPLLEKLEKQLVETARLKEELNK